MDAGPTASRAHEKNCSSSWRLSPARKTRHFRPKRMILFAKLMSGSSKKPDTDPTFPTQNPTFGCRMGANATTLLTILTILRMPRNATF